jgi:hypothetical protein
MGNKTKSEDNKLIGPEIENNMISKNNNNNRDDIVLEELS